MFFAGQGDRQTGHYPTFLRLCGPRTDANIRVGLSYIRAQSPTTTHLVCSLHIRCVQYTEEKISFNLQGFKATGWLVGICLRGSPKFPATIWYYEYSSDWVLMLCPSLHVPVDLTATCTEFFFFERLCASLNVHVDLCRVRFLLFPRTLQRARCHKKMLGMPSCQYTTTLLQRRYSYDDLVHKSGVA